MTYDMVSQQRWHCPEGLIEQALAECPITDEVVVLNQTNGDFFYGSWTIKDEYKGTAWERILMSLPGPIGEARIITLAPGESYMAHADIDNRWHLNLTGQRSFLIDLDAQEMFECNQDNHWYLMCTDKIHSAANFGSTPRLQLVVREPLRTPVSPKDLINVTIKPAYEQYDYRYKFDNIFSPWLNRVNYDYKMAEFSPKEMSVSFKLEKELKEELDAITTKDFTVTYG
jgi:hypothetical protein